jgi:hypothetical protein
MISDAERAVIRDKVLMGIEPEADDMILQEMVDLDEPITPAKYLEVMLCIEMNFILEKLTETQITNMLPQCLARHFDYARDWVPLLKASPAIDDGEIPQIMPRWASQVARKYRYGIKRGTAERDRAMGAILWRAAKEGMCGPTDEWAWSKRERRPIRVWKSLIYQTD